MIVLARLRCAGDGGALNQRDPAAGLHAMNAKVIR